MGNAIRKELKLENVWFVYPKPEAFYSTLWKWPPMIFLIYRVLTALYVVSFFIETTIVFSLKPVTRHNIMTFLTTWTYLILTLHLSVAACTTVYSFWKSKQRINQGTAVLKSLARRQSSLSHVNPTFEQDITMECNGKTDKEPAIEVNNGSSHHGGHRPSGRAPETEVEIEEEIKKEEPAPLAVQINKVTWYMKMSWMLYDVICIMAPIVSVVYFTSLFPKVSEQRGGGISLEDLNVHGINSIIVFVEMCLTSYPVRLLHALYPVMYGFAYVVFSLSYWSGDPVNNVLYPGFLDWNSPGKAIMFVLAVAFIGIPFLQFVHFGLYLLKMLVYKKLYGRPYLE